MKQLFKKCTLAAVVISSFATTAISAAEAEVNKIIFKNVNIFNGVDNKLYNNHSVLVEDKMITQISAKDINVLNKYKEKFKVIMKDGKVLKNTL